MTPDENTQQQAQAKLELMLAQNHITALTEKLANVRKARVKRMLFTLGCSGLALATGMPSLIGISAAMLLHEACLELMWIATTSGTRSAVLQKPFVLKGMLLNHLCALLGFLVPIGATLPLVFMLDTNGMRPAAWLALAAAIFFAVCLWRLYHKGGLLLLRSQIQLSVQSPLASEKASIQA